jgi:hypothetical protein
MYFRNMSQNDLMLQKVGKVQPFALYRNRTVFYRIYGLTQPYHTEP